MGWYNRNQHVDRALLRVSYDSYREYWQVLSEHVAPGGVLSRHDTKKSAVKEARKVAKHRSVKPSKLIVEQKNWSGVEDEKVTEYG